MIILIGGAGCTGKTRIACDLMMKFKIPYFSLDVLMMGIFRSDNECGFTPMSDVDSINKALWPIIYQMIKTNIENRTDYIYEGIQIQPKNICEIEKEYKNHIKSYFLNFTKHYLINRYSLISEYRNDIEERNDVDDIETSIINNNKMAEKCIRWKQEIYSFNSNYKSEKKKLLKMIESDINIGKSKEKDI